MTFKNTKVLSHSFLQIQIDVLKNLSLCIQNTSISIVYYVFKVKDFNGDQIGVLSLSLYWVILINQFCHS